MAFFGFAPWAAVQAVGGRWGVTATMLGIAFIVASPVAMCFWGWAHAIGTSWALYGFWLLGYWNLVGPSFSWGSGIDPHEIHGLDGLVVFLASVLGISAQGLLVLAVPLVGSFASARTVHNQISRRARSGGAGEHASEG